MGKVYIVSDGSYSDRCDYAAFTTRAAAEAYREARGFDNEIEELPLDEPAESLPECPPGLHRWYVSFTHDGGWWVRRRDDTEPLGSEGGVGMVSYHTDCYARDEEHAAKVGMEKRAQWIAQQPPGFDENDEELMRPRTQTGVMFTITKEMILKDGLNG